MKKKRNACHVYYDIEYNICKNLYIYKHIIQNIIIIIIQNNTK